ncbi:MAG: hypothetical protein ABIG11_10700 [bacterium]
MKQFISFVVRCFPLLASLVLLPLLSYAGGTEGAVPFNFLFMDAGARPAALGGAYAAAANDANALSYNPAGLAAFEPGHIIYYRQADKAECLIPVKPDRQNHAVFQHTGHFQGVTREYGALSLKNGFGFMLNTVSFGDIRRTTLSNPRGTGLGAFGIRDWEVSLGYGRSYLEGLIGLGAAVKYLYEKIDTESAHAAAADFGAMFYLDNFGLPLVLGVSAQNFGTKVRFKNTGEELPTNVRTGLAYYFSGIGLFVADVNLPGHGNPTVHFGGEYTPLERLALRLGYNGRNDAGGVTAGIGIKISRFSADYAFVPYGDLGSSHQLSVSCRW